MGEGRFGSAALVKGVVRNRKAHLVSKTDIIIEEKWRKVNDFWGNHGDNLPRSVDKDRNEGVTIHAAIIPNPFFLM